MSWPRLATVQVLLLQLLLTAGLSCRCGDNPSGEPSAAPERTALAAPSYDPEWKAATSAPRPPGAARPVVGRPTPSIAPSPDDPLQGRWSLAAATAEMPPGKGLLAHIETAAGVLRCALETDKAPVAVANFTGLANGTRLLRTAAGWRKQPAYDGSSLELISPGLAMRGGRPARPSTPGYVIADEIYDGMSHDRAGLLCMASRGPNTGAMQFLITLGPAHQLDPVAARYGSHGAYTIFGSCGPGSLLRSLASQLDSSPRTAIAIKTIRVTRP